MGVWKKRVEIIFALVPVSPRGVLVGWVVYGMNDCEGWGGYYNLHSNLKASAILIPLIVAGFHLRLVLLLSLRSNVAD